jgi:hypothetical protein
MMRDVRAILRNMGGKFKEKSNDIVYMWKAYIEMVNKNKGCLEVGIFISCYLGAMEELKKQGIDQFKIIALDGKEYDVVIDNQVEELVNLIKRKMLLDIKDKNAVKRTIEKEQELNQK